MTSKVIEYHPYGASAELFATRAPEVLIEGSAGTGKSRACLEKIHLQAMKYPNARIILVRKYRQDLTESAIQTLENHVFAPEDGVTKLGGSQVQHYDYPNGSRIIIAGLDRDAKVMSAEYDCLVGETIVDSPSAVERAYGRPYSGKLVSIATAAGNQITGTPNHPVLTDHGWVGLSQLRKGDYVVSRSRKQQESFGADPDVADQPASIEQVARALAEANPSGAQRVETVPVDFHGDGAYGYVDVVSTAGLFEHCPSAAFLNPIAELQSGGRDFQQSALVGQRPRVERSLGRNSSGAPDTAELPHSFPVGLGIHPSFSRQSASLSDVSPPFSVGIPYPAQGLSLRLRAPRDSARAHLLLEPTNADVNGFGDGQHAPLPSDVTLDRIINITGADAGPGRHVFNLQTSDHWYYANNIVSHNCAYVQEATELDEEEWEKLASRLRNGRMPYQQLIGDCNPDSPMHWLNLRCNAGITKRLQSKHEDNPTLWDTKTGKPTEHGAAYLARLDTLTGVRKDRLRYGKWVAAEGMIYMDSWDRSKNVIDAPKEWGKDEFGPVPPKDWSRYWSVDFGFTHPFVLGMWAEDGDGRLWLYRQIYHTQRLVEDHAKRAIEIMDQRPRAVIVDHDAEDRATLSRYLRMPTIPARKEVGIGIQSVAARMKLAGDGRPRLLFVKGSLLERDPSLIDARRPGSTEDEVEGYVWNDRTRREEPRKEADDGMDMTRYVVTFRDWQQSRRGTVPIDAPQTPPRGQRLLSPWARARQAPAPERRPRRMVRTC